MISDSQDRISNQQPSRNFEVNIFYKSNIFLFQYIMISNQIVYLYINFGQWALMHKVYILSEKKNVLSVKDFPYNKHPQHYMIDIYSI